MSKAFTREDDAPDLPLAPRLPEPLPPGLKNYLTEGGALRLREELQRLLNVDRPRLNALPPDSARRELQAVDQRITHLHQSLQSAVVVPAPPEPHDQVRFGATVTVSDGAGRQLDYRIVGLDEIDLDRNWISFRSPVARALLNGRVGGKARFGSPSGEQELKILSVRYEN